MSAGEEIHLHTIDRDGDEHMQCENSMENKKKTDYKLLCDPLIHCCVFVKGNEISILKRCWNSLC